MNVSVLNTNEGILTLALSGRIDSTNASAADEQITKALAENAHTALVIDAEALEYISSAGLRVVLKTRKAEPTLELVNVSAEVYDIFDMTGFTEMIPVKKAYRRLNVEGCEVIGQGANGKVYRLDPDTIIKVYSNPDCLPDISRERELARRAFVLGVPTAIPYDVVRVGESYGSVFELLNAKSLADLLRSDPDGLDRYVGISVDLLKKIHATEVRPEDMPDMRDVAIGWASFLCDYLPAEAGEKLVALMRSVPVDHHMMHGDYHVKNVMIQNGEALLIDMDTLCQGNPIFELASMFNAYVGFSELDHTVCEKFLGIPYDVCVKFWDESLRLYLGTDDTARIADVERRAKLIGDTRLMRRLIRRGGLESEIGKKEIELYRNNIVRLLGEIDTLAL